LAIPGAIRLKHDLPKWWGKFEIHADTSIGPALVLDLDVVLLSQWVPTPEHRLQPIVWRDPIKQARGDFNAILGGILYLPPDTRARMASDFFKNPARCMAKYGGDDQPYLRNLMQAESPLRGQDTYLDEVVSFKVHVAGLGLRPANKIVLFHGLPRPWDVQYDWIPRLNDSQPLPAHHADPVRDNRLQVPGR
jgi:hypothetical protein